MTGSSRILVGVCVAALSAFASPNPGVEQRLGRYNVVWNSPSKDAAGVMPVGNGDIAAGVYAIENGDLYLLLAKSDAYNYMGDLLKTGRVRVSLNPNPFAAGKPFRQTLDLATGSIQIWADGIEVRIWADANNPIQHVDIVSPREVAVAVQPEFWKRFDHCGFDKVRGYSQGVVNSGEAPQDTCLERNGKLLWYFSNGDRSVWRDDLKYYQVEAMAGKLSDPYRFNTFGNLVESPELASKAGALAGSGRRFEIRIHALARQTSTPGQWIEAIEQQSSLPANASQDWKQHVDWWSDFWNRGWIIASDTAAAPAALEKLEGEAGPNGMRIEPDGAALVSQSYNVFRFLMACQSRGRVPAKFNGGLFTQQFHVLTNKGIFGIEWQGATQLPDGSWMTHEDYRDWGRRFTYQNQRLLYWPLLASGDFDLMKPFFDYYSSLLPMRQAVTESWFGHPGAYFRENTEPDGAERDDERDGRPPKTKPGDTYDGSYHDYYFTGGLETTAMMLDYVNFSGDTVFRDRTLVPFARQIMLFYERHYPRVAGKLRITPSQVLETWWVAVNPAPDVAGLRFCLDGLLAMKAGSASDQASWAKFRAEIPEIPLRTIGGAPAIAPAEKFEKRQNSENGELYPVFPFRCFGLGLGSEKLVNWTMKHRTCPDANASGCWSQDQIQWAYGGNAAEAAAGLVRRFRLASAQCRFPLYGRQTPDSCPDLDHFGSGSIALQRMLAQEAGGKILLLPAWPANWNVDFKLHLSGGAVLSGCVKDGKLERWNIEPLLRRKDVVVCAPQRILER